MDRCRARPAGAAFAGLALLTALGCASLTARAPLVTAEMGAAAAARGIDAAAPERGRAIYVGRCTRCHGPVTVADRSPQQWRRILPAMAQKAKLTAAEAGDVTAYVEVVTGNPLR